MLLAVTVDSSLRATADQQSADADGRSALVEQEGNELGQTVLRVADHLGGDESSNGAPANGPASERERRHDADCAAAGDDRQWHRRVR